MSISFDEKLKLIQNIDAMKVNMSLLIKDSLMKELLFILNNFEEKSLLILKSIRFQSAHN